MTLGPILQRYVVGGQVMEVLSRYARFMDADLQQRAVEYMGLVLHPDVAKRNVTTKPPWEKRGSLLLRRLMHRAVRFQHKHACIPFPPLPMHRVSSSKSGMPIWASWIQSSRQTWELKWTEKYLRFVLPLLIACSGHWLLLWGFRRALLSLA